MVDTFTYDYKIVHLNFLEQEFQELSLRVSWAWINRKILQLLEEGSSSWVLGFQQHAKYRVCHPQIFSALLAAVGKEEQCFGNLRKMLRELWPECNLNTFTFYNLKLQQSSIRRGSPTHSKHKSTTAAGGKQ